MKLMIIESPGKIKKLSSILGSSWKIAASVGHIRDLPTKEMGVEAPEFKPNYQLTERGSDVVKRLKNLVREADEIYLATDPDREGESISWHLKESLQLKNPKRVAFNEITQAAVTKALASPRTINGPLVAAQEARRVLDRLVGYTVSPELSRQTGEKLSAGRVQSPAVRLVVDREREIQRFKVTQHYGFQITLNGPDTSEWRAEWQTKPDFVTEDAPYFLNRDFALRVGQTAVEVIDFTEGESRRSPPPPFTTSSLQQAASVALNLNPKAAMEAAQKLYEQGHITYHRTDNPNISEESLGAIRAVAEQLGLDMAPALRKFKAPDGAQEGHPAITPTHWEVVEAGETPSQKALYQLIRHRALACQLTDAIYAVRTAQLKGLDLVDEQLIRFEAKGRTLIEPGWRKLTDHDQTEEKESAVGEIDNPIPLLRIGQVIAVTGGKLLEKKTKPPTRYTEATLIKKLESVGIGRPATYAAIMDNITSRGYVRTEKKFLIPTATGETIVDALTGQFSFVELGYTRDIEASLDRIAQGKASYLSVVGGLYANLQQEMQGLQVAVSASPAHPCPSCGKPLRRIKGGSGFFWGCTGYPDCSETLPDAKGQPGVRKEVRLSEHACPACGKPLVHRQKKGKTGYDFWGCSGFKDGCRQSFPNKGGQPQLNQPKESV